MRRWAVVMAGLVLCATVGAQAQAPFQVRGRAVRVTTGGPVPLTRVWVTLHRVAGPNSGPIDSVETDGRGRYGFAVPTPDSTAMYLTTLKHAGIAYFAPPVHAHDVGAEGTIEAFDTTSAPATLRIVGRHLVVAAAGADGMREVMDIAEISNEGILTRIGSAEHPTFLAPLPTGATNVRATQGDFTGEAARVTPQGLAVLAPFAPGVRQLAVSYQLPARAFPLSVALTDSTAVVEVLVEDSLATVTATGVQREGPIASDGRVFTRYLGRDVPGPARIEVAVPAPPQSGMLQRVGLPLLLAFAAIGAIGWTIRPRRGREQRTSAPSTTDRATELRSAIAGVDATLTAADTAPSALGSLREYRQTLQAELDTLLAESAESH